jgi:CRP/FNR family cyclic AMP-dependent transcriptional regulator
MEIRPLSGPRVSAATIAHKGLALAAPAIDEGSGYLDATPAVTNEWQEILTAVEGPITHGCYPAGYVLAAQDRAVQQLVHVESGLVKLVQRGPDGNDVVIAVRGKGWPLGLEEAVLSTRRQTSIVALTNCTVVTIDASAFRARAFADVDIATHVVRLTSALALERTHQLAVFGSFSARRRLELLLCRLADALGSPRADGSVWLKLSPPQREWAEIIWVAPETLSRLMADLERDTVIRRTPGAVIITNRARLQDATLE